jgi:hypothetical protein
LVQNGTAQSTLLFKRKQRKNALTYYTGGASFFNRKRTVFKEESPAILSRIAAAERRAHTIPGTVRPFSA